MRLYSIDRVSYTCCSCCSSSLIDMVELITLAWLPLMSNVGIPIMWAYLLCNVLTQYFCIRSVFILTTECSSLIVTLVITLRKFFSLLVSIIYFQNEFTFYHYIGTACVFFGTFLFSNIHGEIVQFLMKKRQHVHTE
jgi:solute carrier family 35 (UDP-xylose/UDP-N-acetylglucosamine transporter), member B4